MAKKIDEKELNKVDGGAFVHYSTPPQKIEEEKNKEEQVNISPMKPVKIEGGNAGLIHSNTNNKK